MAAMAVNTSEGMGVCPVFIQSRSLSPDNDKPHTVHELCAAAEQKCGFISVLGVQRTIGVWRLYPKTEDFRTWLLLEGNVVRRHSVTTHGKNPFIV